MPQPQKCSLHSLNQIVLIRQNCKKIFIFFRSSSTDKYYDLPVIRTQRSSSFGYGKKTDFGKNGRFTPAPGAY
jgi:hypothetical protein